MAATAGPVFAQAVSAAAPPLRVIKRPLVAWMASRKHVAPDTLAQFTTGIKRATVFRALMAALADRDWAQVDALAAQISYDVAALRESRIWFAIAYDRRGRDPTVIVNLKPRRELIVGAPHVPFERGTAEQAMILLRDVGARAAIVSGAHRCASQTFTTCDGQTSVCGTLQAYRDSDPGHNDKTLFHAAHTVLAERWPNTIVISLHGMQDDDQGVRTAMIVSNGIKADDDDKLTAASRLRTLLRRALKPAGTVVSCNVSADAKYDFRLLCGHTNVQGRHVNGDADACHGSVTEGTGRFVHLEQDRDVRDPYADDWRNIDQYPFNNALIFGLKKVAPRVP